jgi:hypothetical protein
MNHAASVGRVSSAHPEIPCVELAHQLAHEKGINARFRTPVEVVGSLAFEARVIGNASGLPSINFSYAGQVNFD